MDRFLALLLTGFDCLLYGFVLTVATMAIIYFLLQCLSKNCVRTIPFFITGIFLFPLLIIQNSLMVGAFKAKSMMTSTEILIEQLVGTNEGPMDMSETQAVLSDVEENIPIVGVYVNLTNMEVANAQQLIHEMPDLINHYLNIYIWKRIGWSTLFIIVAIIIAMLADKRNADGMQHSRRDMRTTGRRTSPVRSSRRHRY